MKPVFIIAIVVVFAIGFTSSVFAQSDSDYNKCAQAGGLLDQQRCRIQWAEDHPGCVQKEYHVIDGKCVPPPNSEEDKSTYQPTCAEGDVLQDGVCIVTNPQPVYANENSWFGWIFDWLGNLFK